MRQYHTLLSRMPGESWAIEFGDYSMSVVRAEMSDMRDSYSHDRGRKYTVITTGDKQSEIDSAVAALNARCNNS